MRKLLSVFIIMFCFLNNAKSQCIDSTLINPFLYLSDDLCTSLCQGHFRCSNDCLAQCDGNISGPVDPTLNPGMPCSLSLVMSVIYRDSVPCNYPNVIEAKVSAGTGTHYINQALD